MTSISQLSTATSTRPKPFRRPSYGPDRWRHRFRRRLDTRVRVRRIVAVAIVVAAVIGLGPGGRLRSTDAPGEAAGARQVSVVTAARELRPGEVVTVDDVHHALVEHGRLPPDRAVDPIGSVVTSPIYRGEIVLTARLGSEHRLGLRADEVAVGLTLDPTATSPRLEPGELVEPIAIVADDLRGVASHRLEPVRVLHADDTAITVAVRSEAAPRLLELRAIGTIEIALTPWGS